MHKRLLFFGAHYNLKLYLMFHLVFFFLEPKRSAMTYRFRFAAGTQNRLVIASWSTLLSLAIYVIIPFSSKNPIWSLELRTSTTRGR